MAPANYQAICCFIGKEVCAKIAQTIVKFRQLARILPSLAVTTDRGMRVGSIDNGSVESVLLEVGA